jgi:putative PIN family toxin of toxin-antitoxin system
VSSSIRTCGFRRFSTRRERRFVLVFSEPLRQELHDVLGRPRIAKKYGLSRSEIATYVGFLHGSSRIVEPSGAPFDCRDPKDDVFLETAVLGEATVVLSRDEDLTRDTVLSSQLEKRGITVLTVRKFLDFLASHQ